MLGDLSILRCPICRGHLELSGEVICEKCGAHFLKSGGLPVLIDFEDSILTPQNYIALTGAAVPRNPTGTIVGRSLAAITYGKDHETTQRNIEAFIGSVFKISREPAILVIGGGTIGNGVSALYSEPKVKVTGVDVYSSPNVDIICDGHKLPFADESFDGVVIQAVLEHVLEPFRVVEEIYRVLRPNGLVYAETPFMQQVHERAYDFTRFTFNGHRWLFRKFTEIDGGLLLGPGISLLWSISYYLRSTGFADRLVALITALFFWVRLCEKRGKRGASLDAASGLYFLGSKSLRHLRANEMPSYYERCRVN